MRPARKESILMRQQLQVRSGGTHPLASGWRVMGKIKFSSSLNETISVEMVRGPCNPSKQVVPVEVSEHVLPKVLDVACVHLKGLD